STCNIRLLHSFPTRRSSDLWLIKIPNRAPSVAASRSASAKKMFGDLPPSSRDTFFRFDEATPRRISRPVSVPPVNAILSTCNDRSEEHTSELQSRFDLVCRL